MLVLCASVALALVAGHRGAAYLGDELGTSIAKLTGPSRRRTKDLYGVPREGLVGGSLAHEPSASSEPRAPEAKPGSPVSSSDAPPPPPLRTRGVFVPAKIVLAYARRGAVPAVDTAQGPTLRGVGTGNGLEDGDVVIRVGRASVRSLREITGIVQASILAGYRHVDGTIRRGDQEIAVTVELPTGAEEP